MSVSGNPYTHATALSVSARTADAPGLSSGRRISAVGWVTPGGSSLAPSGREAHSAVALTAAVTCGEPVASATAWKLPCLSGATTMLSNVLLRAGTVSP